MKKLLFFLIIVFLSCKEEFIEPAGSKALGLDYYPLKEGDYRIYKIDSIVFDIGDRNLPIQLHSTSYLREEIIEHYTNELDESLFRVQRTKANDLNGPWTPRDIIVRSRNDRQAFLVEDNVRLINLIFPLKEGRKWNGNAYVKDGLIVFVRGESLEMYKDWQYEVLSVDVAEKVGDIDYDRVVTISQANVDNVIERRFSIEKYAAGIGLISRERQITDSYCKYTGITGPCVGKDWIDKAGRGFFTKETLIEYN